MSRRALDDNGYGEMAQRMRELSAAAPGFLGVQTARGEDGLGISVSYWQSLKDIQNWREDLEHRQAQEKGKAGWYTGYQVRICKVERQYNFGEV